MPVPTHHVLLKILLIIALVNVSSGVRAASGRLTRTPSEN